MFKNTLKRFSFSTKRHLDFRFVDGKVNNLDYAVILNSPLTTKIPHLMKENLNIIFCDGGVNRRNDYGITDEKLKILKNRPLVVGDFDSIEEFDYEKFNYHKEPDQDFNDMEKGLRVAADFVLKEEFKREILITGVVGGRLDHSM